MNIPKLKSNYSKIDNLLHKSYFSAIIKTAIKLNVFELLSNKGLTIEEIVQKTKTDKNVTKSLLRTLISVELLKQDGKVFSLTTESKEYLTKKSEANQLHALEELMSEEEMIAKLSDALKGNFIKFDSSRWSTEKVIHNMEQGAKAGKLQRVLAFVEDIPEFKKATKMCDFAGNSGYYSYGFLQINPLLHSFVYDQPDVCKNAKEIKKNEETFNRITYQPFEMNLDESYGKDFDFFFVSNCLYGIVDKETDELQNLFKKINRALKIGSLLVSNHSNGETTTKESEITRSVFKLMIAMRGRDMSFSVPEKRLKEVLTKAGFGKFNVQLPDENTAMSSMLLSAIKIKEV